MTCASLDTPSSAAAPVPLCKSALALSRPISRRLFAPSTGPTHMMRNPNTSTIEDNGTIICPVIEAASASECEREMLLKDLWQHAPEHSERSARENLKRRHQLHWKPQERARWLEHEHLIPPISHSKRPLRYTGASHGRAREASGSPILSASDRARVEDFSLNSLVAFSKKRVERTSQTFNPCKSVGKAAKIIGRHCSYLYVETDPQCEVLAAHEPAGQERTPPCRNSERMGPCWQLQASVAAAQQEPTQK